MHSVAVPVGTSIVHQVMESNQLVRHSFTQLHMPLANDKEQVVATSRSLAKAVSLVSVGKGRTAEASGANSVQIFRPSLTLFFGMPGRSAWPWDQGMHMHMVTNSPPPNFARCMLDFRPVHMFTSRSRGS
jgi:hypothetical protein